MEPQVQGDPVSDELGGAPILVVTVTADDGHVGLSLAGELDLHGVEELSAAVDRVLGDGAVNAVDIDLRELGFIDSSGLGGVLAARAAVTATGATFHLVGVSPSVARVMEIAGLDDTLEVPGTT